MQTITQQLAATVESLFSIQVDPQVTRPEPQFGDFASNIALQLNSQLPEAGGPRAIAEQIAESLRSTYGLVVQVAGPGFLNITVSDAQLAQELQIMSADTYRATISGKFAGSEVVIETNNPNPFKDIHIGHAMNSIVADTLANLLERSGAIVHRVSYHGDVGLHVAKSLWAILDELGQSAPELLAQVPVAERAVKLRDWYARGAGLYEEDALVREQIEQLIPQTFTRDDPLLSAVYDICKSWSFEYFAAVFARLGSKPTERAYLESETDQAGRALVESALGRVFTESQGAIIFDGEQYGLHTRVFISARGTTLYEARDLGLMELKATEYPAAVQSFVVTAEEQREYFKVVNKAAELADPALSGKTTNISTGTVKLSTGKMSSRTGNVINISWLFDILTQAVQQRGAEGDAVEQSVLGALRYTMLKNRITSDTIFDIEQSVALEGNTGPYLQYAHARACSILAKLPAQSPVDISEVAFDPAERRLQRKLSEYSDLLQRAADELMPHSICTYLYELCQEFNRFYEVSKVVGDPREALRSLLVRAHTKTLRDGLSVLGIAAPEHM